MEFRACKFDRNFILRVNALELESLGVTGLGCRVDDGRFRVWRPGSSLTRPSWKGNFDFFLSIRVSSVRW